MKYNNIIFLGLCLGLTTYSALSADSVIKFCIWLAQYYFVINRLSG
ncbi:hypothetical protein LSE28_002595 [Escherichia coli]|nr:hypothetical protein [Escherichia coli]